MKPILVVQHQAGVGPGNFADWARDAGQPLELLRIDRAEALPASAARFAGICSLGGDMSVNDALPWIDGELALMRDADARGVPLIGHCLGAQLMARALGAPVQRAEHLELGWCTVRADDERLARDWLGAASDHEFFQWHGDTFELPAGARRLLAGTLCANQAFVVQREGFAHLGMQFHCEVTPAIVRQWVEDPEGARAIMEDGRADGPGVQSAETMLSDLPARAARMDSLARRLYQRWAQGLAR